VLLDLLNNEGRLFLIEVLKPLFGQVIKPSVHTVGVVPLATVQPNTMNLHYDGGKIGVTSVSLRFANRAPPVRVCARQILIGWSSFWLVLIAHITRSGKLQTLECPPVSDGGSAGMPTMLASSGNSHDRESVQS
jgi:hypothetical protein